MKELSENELLQLAQSETKKMDMHLWSQIILSILVIIQATFLIFDIISFNFYFCIWLIFMVLYVFHNKKIKKSEIKMQEILDELTSRNI